MFMPHLLILFKKYFCLVGWAATLIYTASECSAQPVINISSDYGLKDIFDSGLRPFRQPGFEQAQVRIEPTDVALNLYGEIEIPPMKWNTLRFNVIDDYRITDMLLISAPITLEQARSAIVPYVKFLNGASKDCDAFFKDVQEKGFFFTREFHLSTLNSRRPSLMVSFNRTGINAKPLSLEINVDWHIEAKKRTSFFEGPIPPPKGYETVSMDKPPSSKSIVRIVPVISSSVTAQPSSAKPQPKVAATPAGDLK